MHKLSRKLLLGLAGIVTLLFVIAVATGFVVYKPWGVADSEREKYDQIVARNRHRNDLIEQLAEIPHPAFSLNTREVEFDRLQPNQPVVEVVSVFNPGSKELHVTLPNDPTNQSDQASDLKVTMDRETLPPGEYTQLRIEWTATEPLNRPTRQVRLRSNDPLNELVIVTVTGRLAQPIVTPSEVALGRTDAFEAIEQELVVCSERWDDFEVTRLDGEADGLQWNTEPLSISDHRIAEMNPRSAKLIRFSMIAPGHGEITDTFQCEIKSKSETTEQIARAEIPVTGRVKPPITFNSPALDRRSGLDFGIVHHDQSKTHHVSVRVRDAGKRELIVLRSSPEQIQTEIKSGREGTYRLSLSIPEGSEPVIFNRGNLQGFVEVGDPNEPTFSSWFPIRGAIVEIH